MMGKYVKRILSFCILLIFFLPVVLFGANFYPAHFLTGGAAGALDAITGYSDGDAALVILDDGGTYKGYLYRYDSAPTGSPAESPPDVIAPDDIGGSAGRWMLVEFYTKVIVVSQSATSPGRTIIYEQSTNGTNYYILTVPASIVSNETFTVGRWRNEAKTLTDADFDIEVDETKTTFVCTIAGLTADRAGNLPPATGSGVEVVYYITDGDDTYDLRAEPDGTDVIGGGAAGHYWECKVKEGLLWVRDIAIGKWAIINALESWVEES